MHWKQVVAKIVDIIQNWEQVEAITKHVMGKSIYDIQFAIDIDVYCTQLPYKTKRRKAFDFVDLYECVTDRNQDHLLIDNVPIYLRYCLIKPIETQCNNQSRAQRSIDSLVLFWRITQTELLFSRTKRIEALRENVANMPPGFWVKHRRVLTDSLREDLRVLRLAMLYEDPYQFFCAATDFSRSFTSLLFCLNRYYEPPEYLVSAALKEQKVVPSSILNRFNFFMFDASLTPAQRYEIAEHLVHVS